MKKRFAFVISFLMVVTSVTFSQRIEYSTNHLIYSPKYQYKIIGKVKDNIIIWKAWLSNRSKSKIFVYDNSMKLLNAVNTNILKSDAFANAQFFVTNNFFWIAYQYKYKNFLVYKLARFDENGSIKSIQNLDSITANDQSLLNQTFFYKILVSANNTLCFTKMTYDQKNYAIKFNCNYVSEKNTVKKNFVIPFDESHENLANIIIDSNNNILLLKNVETASSVNLRLIKKNFDDDLMLISDKVIKDYQFQRKSISIAQKNNGYIIFGDVYNADKNKAFKNGLYVWQTDSLLNDYSEDTIIKNTENNISTLTANISASNKFGNAFVAWDMQKFNDTGSTYKTYNTNTTTPVSTPTSSDFIYPSSYETGSRADGAYIPPAYIVNQRETQTPDYNNLSPVMVSSTQVNSMMVVDNKIEIFSINNNNKFIWTNTFKVSLTNVTTVDFVNAVVVAGSKAIHLIYQTFTGKKLAALNQIIINADGSYTNDFFASWNPKYYYDLSEYTLLNNSEFIVPAKNGFRIVFAKMKVE